MEPLTTIMLFASAPILGKEVYDKIKNKALDIFTEKIFDVLKRKKKTIGELSIDEYTALLYDTLMETREYSPNDAEKLSEKILQKTVSQLEVVGHEINDLTALVEKSFTALNNRVSQELVEPLRETQAELLQSLHQISKDTSRFTQKFEDLIHRMQIDLGHQISDEHRRTRQVTRQEHLKTRNLLGNNNFENPEFRPALSSNVSEDSQEQEIPLNIHEIFINTLSTLEKAYDSKLIPIKRLEQKLSMNANIILDTLEELISQNKIHAKITLDAERVELYDDWDDEERQKMKAFEEEEDKLRQEERLRQEEYDELQDEEFGENINWQNKGYELIKIIKEDIYVSDFHNAILRIETLIQNYGLSTQELRYWENELSKLKKKREQLKIQFKNWKD